MGNGNEPLHMEVDEVLDNDSFYQQESDERDKHWWEHQDRSKHMTDQVTGVLTSANPSQSGKSIACYVDGQKFTCIDFGIQSQVGNEITFEAEESEFKGNTFYKIKKWSPTGGDVSNTSPKTNGASSISSSKQDLPLPFISNTVATCITVGLIKQPEEIEKWVKACQMAVLSASTTNLVKDMVKDVVDNNTIEPDEKIPF